MPRETAHRTPIHEPPRDRTGRRLRARLALLLLVMAVPAASFATVTITQARWFDFPGVSNDRLDVSGTSTTGQV